MPIINAFRKDKYPNEGEKTYADNLAKILPSKTTAKETDVQIVFSKSNNIDATSRLSPYSEYFLKEFVLRFRFILSFIKNLKKK